MINYEFLEKVKSSKLMPKKIEICNWQKQVLVSCYDYKNSQFISESVSMGIDSTQEIAISKSIVEYLERKLIKTSTSPEAFATERSDGFAAFPVTNNFDSKSIARYNAFHEATERFLWVEWWDNLESYYELKSEINNDIYKDLVVEYELKNLLSINVPTECKTSQLYILVAQTKNDGFFSGGAASCMLKTDSAKKRAFGELLRHLVSFNRMAKLKSDSHSFYEKRLYGFGSGLWGDLVLKRLECNGNCKINLPNLSIDAVIRHQYENLISIHRCLFHNQKKFMGGEIERFCI